eukprot:Clim_evm5s171 gene=Clim_evmTU5s171
MGLSKKERRSTKKGANIHKGTSFKSSNAAINPNRKLVNGKPTIGKRVGSTQLRDKSTIQRLAMYKSGGKVVRNRKGEVVKEAPFQSKLTSGTVARVQPDRRWFGNTRVVGQSDLEKFKEAAAGAEKDPYQVVLRRNKLPMALIRDGIDNEKTTSPHVKILEVEGFDKTFGKKAQRKRPKLQHLSMTELASAVETKGEEYDSTKDRDVVREDMGTTDETAHRMFSKGQSKRIWGELHKVIDSSDVVVQVLDARDPLGTRSTHVEEFIQTEAPHKHVVLVLNKVDLVPTWVTEQWVRNLSAEYPTIAFHASITNPFGKGSLIQLLRQFSHLHKDRRQISVGFIGYPNVGKSSVINALKAAKVCKTAPIPGETKVWQYITLFRRIYLIDCPGVVHSNEKDTEAEAVLKSVVRIENLETPEDYIEPMLERINPLYIKRTYNVDGWEDGEDFLDKLARKSGRLLKGGEADIRTVAKMVLSDWQRGRLPHFVPTGEKDDTANGGEAGDVAVAQDFKNIKVASNVLGAGSGRPAKVDVDDEESAAEDEKAHVEVDNEEQADAKEPDWDQVFASVEGRPATAAEVRALRKEQDLEDDDGDDDDDDDDGDMSDDEEEHPRRRKPKKVKSGDTEKDKTADEPEDDDDERRNLRHSKKKEKRMTTNKKLTGEKYYSRVNVKNKNLQKRAEAAAAMERGAKRQRRGQPKPRKK